MEFTSHQAGPESPVGKRASPRARQSGREGAGGPKAQLEDEHFTRLTISPGGKPRLLEVL